MTPYRTALCFVVALALFANAAFGQSTSSTLSSGFRQQAAFTAPEVKVVDTWIDGQIDRLTGTDFAVQKEAREVLVAGANGSEAYGEIYATSLNTALIKVLQGKDFRARLNAAIVASHVGDKVKSAHLHDVAMLMIADKDESIVLWGIKTAQSVVPASFAAMGAAAKTDLIDAVEKAAESRKSGMIAVEAYEVLAPRVTGTTISAPLVNAVLPPLLKLMSIRNQQYIHGLPDEPAAENAPLLFLTLGPVWNTLTPAQRVAEMQQISDLVGMAGQRYATASRTDQEILLPLLKQAGSALIVVGQEAGSVPLQTAAGAISKLNLSVPAATISSATAAIFPAIQAVPAFANLTPPPTVSPDAPTTAPSALTTK